MKKTQKAISLLEVVLALAVIASITMMAVRYYIITLRDTRVSHAISQVKRLTKGSYDWLQAQHQADFSDAAGGQSITLQKLVTDQLIEDKIDTINPWGGTIDISPGSDSDYVQISLDNLPQPACRNLTQQLHYINHTQVLGTCANKTSNTFTGEF
ncbi:MAG: hypothetical protein COB66_07395 [Coxiella sp. (in: Bacteria)]|nr:MAG: hypothetical protein COB66_07395 [Coxiella sp. (in: g-proteobacteria)]